MSIHLFAFSARGCHLARSIADGMGEECCCFSTEKYAAQAGFSPFCSNLSEQTGKSFALAQGIVFIGAAGIAVRAVAPYLKSKTSDPAVVVVDETGRFAVSLLSGHLGGANALAEKVAGIIGALPVITTATDRNGLFAVDVFAKQNSLFITDMIRAKEVSAALLAGEAVGFCSDLPLLSALPPELGGQNAAIGIAVTAKPGFSPFPSTLHLIPRRITAGIGCRRGKDPRMLEQFLLQVLEREQILPEQLCGIASIDLKKDEQGILKLCEKYHLPFITYSSEQLMAVQGDFSASDFVKSQVGVDCVCERAAVLAGGSLVCRKQVSDGITIALAKSEEGIRFEP